MAPFHLYRCITGHPLLQLWLAPKIKSGLHLQNISFWLLSWMNDITFCALRFVIEAFSDNFIRRGLIKSMLCPVIYRGFSLNFNFMNNSKQEIYHVWFKFESWYSIHLFSQKSCFSQWNMEKIIPHLQNLLHKDAGESCVNLTGKGKSNVQHNSLIKLFQWVYSDWLNLHLFHRLLGSLLAKGSFEMCQVIKLLRWI